VNNQERFPYILTTNRNLEHYNCGAQTRRTANVELVTEDVIFVHPDDAAEHGIEDADFVCVESERGKIDIKAKVSDEIKKGVLSTTFHFPEVMVNDLTSDVHDTEAMCPEYKVVSVRIRKARKMESRT
jgi:formate dehydrogenase major subunit